MGIVQVHLGNQQTLTISKQRGSPRFFAVTPRAPKEVLELLRVQLRQLGVRIPSCEFAFEMPFVPADDLPLPGLVGMLVLLKRLPDSALQYAWRGSVRLDGEVVARMDTLPMKNIEQLLAWGAGQIEVHSETQFEEDIHLLDPVCEKAAAIAALGGHSVLVVGPPGTGKTTFCRRIAQLRPGQKGTLVAPHAQSSVESILIDLLPTAHQGVLFLDEFLEFKRPVLEGLRTILDTGTVTVGRVGATRQVPVKTQVLLASNLCACGRWDGDSQSDCGCSDHERRRYLRRLSGPLLRRMDMVLFLGRRQFPKPEGWGRAWIAQAFPDLVAYCHQEATPQRKLPAQRLAETLSAMMRRVVKEDDPMVLALRSGLDVFIKNSLG